MKITTVFILGGTGFVGRHLAAELASRGYHCRIPARHPHRYRDLEVLPYCSVTAIQEFTTDALRQQVEHCDAVINLVGILNESRQVSFKAAHIDLVTRLIDATRGTGVSRYLHMSALNADETGGSSRYLRTKGEGENRAHTRGKPHLAVTSFRPSVIFGRDDSFINRFRELMALPGPMPLACPDARFAPVYIGDVTRAFAEALENPATHGNAYELCGPDEYSLREIVKYIAWHSGRYKAVIGLNDRMSRLQAKMLGMMPGKPFTLDNYLSLQTPSICTQDGLGMLGIEATPMDAIVPDYLR